MAKYMKCPRCELNYIKVEDDYCQVCKAEMKLAPDDSISDDMDLCPVCGQNFVSVDQVMCDECAKKRTLDDVVDESDDSEHDSNRKDEDWDQETKALDSLDSESMNSSMDDDIEVVNFSDLEEDDDDDYIDDDDDSGVDHFEDEDDFDYSSIDDDDFEEDDDEDSDNDDDDDDFDDMLGKK